MTDGKWVEGCLVYNPNIPGFAYIIPFDEVNDMHVKEEKIATVKVIRVMEKSIEICQTRKAAPIIVGEIRGEEVTKLIKGWDNKHSGGMATITS